MFNREVHVFTLENAHKPRKAYRKAMHLMGTNTAKYHFYRRSDFTDIWGATEPGSGQYS